ncbi:exo1, partial [Symbiodinium pilosum]
VQRPVHISEYRGLNVGVDAYCWLHRGKLGYVEALLRENPDAEQLTRGIVSTTYPIAQSCAEPLLRPLRELVDIFRAVGAEPLLVFDGAPLPAKSVTEGARRQAREEAARQAALAGSSAGLAKRLYGAVDITPEMAATCVEHFKPMGVKCIVAPCEADAQLAFLAHSGRLDVVVSEDVDLLAFGCSRVLFGLDIRRGCGQEVRLADIGKCRTLSPYRLTPDTLPDLCVLSGCDYLPSLPRLGLRRAAHFLHRARGCIQRVLQLAQREGINVPESYGQSFAEARLVYSCQLVFDDLGQHLRTLMPIPASADNLRLWQLGIGLFNDKVALEIAVGQRSPITLAVFVDAGSTPTLPGTTCAESISSLPTPVRPFRQPRVMENNAAKARCQLKTDEGKTQCVLDVDDILDSEDRPARRRRLGCRGPEVGLPAAFP